MVKCLSWFSSVSIGWFRFTYSCLVEVVVRPLVLLVLVEVVVRLLVLLSSEVSSVFCVFQKLLSEGWCRGM